MSYFTNAVLPIDVKKSLLAESDSRQLSNNKHQHGSSILKEINSTDESIHYNFTITTFTIIHSSICTSIIVLGLKTKVADMKMAKRRLD